MELRTSLAAAMVALLLFGLNAMYGQLYRSGYIAAILPLIDGKEHNIPGTDIPLLTRYLGLEPLDRLLTLATLLWTNVTDGSAPELSLYVFQFLGQLVPVFTVMLVEGSRIGNQQNVLFNPLLWGYAMQAVGYGVVMPIYCLLHFHLPLHKSAAGYGGFSTREAARIAVIPSAFVAGFFVPSVLMALPFSNHNLHQWLGANWQGFPLWIVLCQWFLVSSHEKSLSVRSTATAAGEASTQTSLRKAYHFALGTAITTHSTTLVIILMCKAFSAIYSDSMYTAITFSRVFWPGMFYSTAKMSSMAEVMHSFFVYDQAVGSAAMLIWAAATNTNSRKPAGTRETVQVLRWISRLAVCITLAGPAGAALHVHAEWDGIRLHLPGLSSS